MAWFGEITNFVQKDDQWICEVAYYDDANPTMRIKRVLNFPLTIVRADAITAIKAKGVEVMRVATINTANIIGSIIPVP